jgi:hypothetical protein
MPIVVASASRSADALISYALDVKADQQGERYVMASGVGGLLVSVAKQQMRDVRKKWNKNKPGAFVHAYHVIESFAKDELDPDDPNSWMTAQGLGRALAEDRFPGRQALVVTQRDGKTGCVHNHIVVNSIETKTGRSLDSSIVMHSRLVEAHERVLEAEGFEQRADLKQAFAHATDRRERGEPSGLRRADSRQQSELREFQRHILWEAGNDIADEYGVAHDPEPFSSTVLKHSIAQALADPEAIDWDSLVEAGRKHGVSIDQRGKKGRGISYGMLRDRSDGTRAEPSPSDRRRCSSLGSEFEMDAVEKALAHNGAAERLHASAAPFSATSEWVSPAATGEKSVPPTPSIEERLRAALNDVNEQANERTQRTVEHYLRAKGSNVEQQPPSEAPEQPKRKVPVTVPPGGAIVSPNRVAEDAKTPARSVPLVPRETWAAVPGSRGKANEEDAQTVREIKARNQRLGLPPVPSEKSAASKALTPEQRKRRLEHPEWFDDIEPATETNKPDHTLGD